MQQYTKSKLQELTDRFATKIEDEYDQATSLVATKGFSMPGDLLFSKFVNIGLKFLDELLEELLSAEKTALLKEASLPSSDYYDVLKDDLVKIANGRIQAIYSHSRIDCCYPGGVVEESHHEMCEQYKQKYATTIANKIGIMQEELRLKIIPQGGTVINVSGDVAVVNTGTVYGSIHGHLEKMKETSVAEVAELFDKLLNAIKDSQITEDEKVGQMQNVDFLVKQYETPKEKRNYGLINASLTLLSLASNLTTLWVQFGPAITEVFKKLPIP